MQTLQTPDAKWRTKSTRRSYPILPADPVMLLYRDSYLRRLQKGPESTLFLIKKPISVSISTDIGFIGVFLAIFPGILPTLFSLIRPISVSSWDRYRFNQYIFLPDFCSISSFSPISVSDIGSSNFNIGVVIINIGWPISVNFLNLYRS